MPIYEYRCERCGNEFEEWQSFSASVENTCPDCGGNAGRLISQSSFVLKGTGWYVTDYGRKDCGGGSTSKPKSSDAGSSSCSTEKTEKTEKKD
jgi:putative FmdB family regulatory protein